jgi:glutamate N-acetyltransferase/amino-acid N-acetyltransferase
MKFSFLEVPGSVVAARGFRASGVFCDIKRLGTGKGSEKGPKSDLALIVSEVPCAVAGLFTTNQVCAAPVKACVPCVQSGTAQAIVANSGNANACTGRQGMRDARDMAACAAAALGLDPSLVLVASTGRIGVPLPMANVRDGIRQAAARLDHSPEQALEAARAIMTSDTQAKHLAIEFELDGKRVRLGGICKGAGMIQPGMSRDGRRPPAQPHATMLCFLTTDAAIPPRLLQDCLDAAVARSFNRITVDGDMSTNDTVLILANGKAGNSKSGWRRPKSESRARFQAALELVCLELAKKIVRDGEGVSRFVTLRVSGARNDAEAEAAGRAVANSSLVKTSWFGGDPNWGRIMDAIGYSTARVIEERVDIGYSAPGSRRIAWSLRRGQPTKATFRSLCEAVAPREFDLHIRLNQGQGAALLYAADLTEEYVEFNKGDISDPTSLGG